MPLLLQVVGQPQSCLLAFLHEIGSHDGQAVLRSSLRDVTVDHDDGDLRLLGFREDGAVAGLNQGGEENRVDLAGDE